MDSSSGWAITSITFFLEEASPDSIRKGQADQNNTLTERIGSGPAVAKMLLELEEVKSLITPHILI